MLWRRVTEEVSQRWVIRAARVASGRGVGGGLGVGILEVDVVVEGAMADRGSINGILVVVRA